VIKGKNGIKSVFVEPEIHYGPFAGTGGASATEYLGNMITKKYGAVPFILHGAVNIELNPISTSEVGIIGRELSKNIEALSKKSFENGKGSIGFGKEGSCKALAINLNSTKIITLTRAPYITEDIDYDVGREFAKTAGKNAIIIDAHNSRFESANKDELKGIYKGSKYVEMYKKAILKAVKAKGSKTFEFGASSFKLSNIIKDSQDLGKGYSSVGIFKFGKERFAMVYFDANNMLPSLREKIIDHIKDKYGIDSEVYTTDTHSVNSLAKPFTNVLGRDTSAYKLIPIIDIMVENALKNIEKVSIAYTEFSIPNFTVWGEDAEEKILEIGKLIIRRLKYAMPFVIAAGFVFAAWIIYLA
jgi:putative membrane protein